MTITIDILPGELFDRISIAALRVRHLPEGEGRRHVQIELTALQAKWDRMPGRTREASRLTEELAAVNAELWNVEDALRLCERRQEFGPRFVELARSVYRLNDRRSQLKREINLSLCVASGEEKVYAS